MPGAGAVHYIKTRTGWLQTVQSMVFWLLRFG